jgi:hypothetical protein
MRSVLALVDGAHAALAEQADDAVFPFDRIPDLKGHDVDPDGRKVTVEVASQAVGNKAAGSKAVGMSPRAWRVSGSGLVPWGAGPALEHT